MFYIKVQFQTWIKGISIQYFVVVIVNYLHYVLLCVTCICVVEYITQDCPITRWSHYQQLQQHIYTDCPAN